MSKCRHSPDRVCDICEPPYQTLTTEPLVSDTHTPETETTPMSNCYSSQAEYEDHDFKDGICKDCGTMDKPGVQEMAKSLEASRAEVERLLALNHRLANRIAGYGDRMQETIGGIIRDAKVEALRGAAEAIVSWKSSPLMCLDKCGDPNCRDDIRVDQVKGTATWLRTRADNLEKP